jgi:16S rRNA (cytosine(967)-C(5))-methyltransferase
MKPFREHHLLAALREWDERNGPLDLALHHYFRKNKALGSKDRAAVAESIYTLVRWQALLDWFCKPPPTWEMRWQLLNSTPLEKLQSAPGLPSHVQVSFPEWLFNKLAQSYGKAQAKQICAISNTQAPPTIRANILKISREDLFKDLKRSYPVEKTSNSPWGITFTRRLNFFELPQFKKGFFEVQDEGSQLVAKLVQPKVGDQVLDFCSGSGGKALAFAPFLKGTGQIYLHDIRERALLEASKRLKRAGIQNAQSILPSSPHLKKLKKKMDWVLVDAPCSGTGTLRRNPDMKWKLSEEDLQHLIGEQRTLFERALSFLKPDGKIVYATCSILQEENEEQAAHFLRTYPLKLAGEPLKLLPSLNGSDGFYAACYQFS